MLEQHPGISGSRPPRASLLPHTRCRARPHAVGGSTLRPSASEGGPGVRCLRRRCCRRSPCRQGNRQQRGCEGLHALKPLSVLHQPSPRDPWGGPQGAASAPPAGQSAGATGHPGSGCSRRWCPKPRSPPRPRQDPRVTAPGGKRPFAAAAEVPGPGGGGQRGAAGSAGQGPADTGWHPPGEAAPEGLLGPGLFPGQMTSAEPGG